MLPARLSANRLQSVGAFFKTRLDGNFHQLSREMISTAIIPAQPAFSTLCRKPFSLRVSSIYF